MTSRRRLPPTTTGCSFLNSHVRYEDLTDGISFTLFVGETMHNGLGLGWASGTRSLRNTGLTAGSGPFLAAGTADAPAPNGGGQQGPASPLFVGGFSSAHPGVFEFCHGRRLGANSDEIDQRHDPQATGPSG